MRRWAVGAVLALAAAWPVHAQPADALAPARAAVERRDFAAALPLYEALLAERPGDADLWIEAARVSGFADRNAEAAARYRRVLAIAPERRADVLPSLAWQTLWAGDAAAAVPLFETLAATGADRADALDGLGQARDALRDADGAIAAWRASLDVKPGQANVERRLARALIWADRHAEADALLAAMLARDPADRRSAWLRAHGWNLAGRHQQALREFERLGGAASTDERGDLARAWAWAGFEDRALPLLERTADADLAWWRDHRVARETRPYAYGSVERASDADDLDVTAAVTGFGWRPAAGATAELRLRRVELDAPGDAAHGRELQALWRVRLGEPGAGHGVWWPSLALRASDWGGWTPWSGHARVTWLPRDGWRLDAEAARELVETPQAIAERVHVDALSLGVDHRPHPRATLSLGVASLRFDDGNARQRVNARAQWLLASRPRWTVGAEALAFDSSRPTSATVPARGYWNPESYREARLFTTVEVEQRPWDLALRLGLGTATEVDGDGNRSHAQPHQWELVAGWDLGASARARLSVGGAGSGFGLGSGGSGYWRRHLSLGLHAWF